MESPKRIKIIDGSFSLQIAKHNDKKPDGDPLWTARYLKTNPEDIIKTHLDYLQAGVDIFETNTYQASVDGFKKYLNLSHEESYNLIKGAVKLAQTAREQFLLESPENQRPLIAGSVGPYGAYLHDLSEYSGSYVKTTPLETIKEYHNQRIKALIEGGVDLLAIETIPCKPEAEILLDLLKEYPAIKAWLSFSCIDEKSIASGENFQEVAKFCYRSNPEQLLAVGINCSNPDYIEPLFEGINERTDPKIPLIVYPNSGEVYAGEKGWVGKEKCKPIEAYVPTWLNLGVTYIGGCCRIGADEILKIKRAVVQWEKNN